MVLLNMVTDVGSKKQIIMITLVVVYQLRRRSNMFGEYKVQEIKRKLEKARFRPFDIMVVGNTGAGKSSTLNLLFEREITKVGWGVNPETMNIDSYSLNDEMRFWDTPGLGDGVKKDEEHERKLLKLLYKTYSMDGGTYGYIDIVLIVVEGCNRDMGTTYKLMNEIIVPHIQKDRILVAINQADLAMKGLHWKKEENCPDEVLQEYLEKQAYSIQKRVKEATGISIKKPVYYSAEKGYNILEFYNLLINNLPEERRKIKT